MHGRVAENERAVRWQKSSEKWKMEIVICRNLPNFRVSQERREGEKERENRERANLKLKLEAAMLYLWNKQFHHFPV